MRLFKKITAIILAVILTVPCALSAVAESGEATLKSNEIKLMESLGIIYSEDYEKPHDSTMTRAEFAMTVIKLRGMENVALTLYNAGYFKDVEADYEEAGFINAAASMGIMKPIKEGIFEPKKAVTSGDAVYALAKVLGYGAVIDESDDAFRKSVDILNKNGISGFPSGVKDTVLTRGDIFKMLEQALNSKVLALKAVGSADGEEFAEYIAGGDVTVLSEYHKVYKRRGIVTANERTSLESSNEALASGETEIDGIIYKDTNGICKELLGYRAEFYYRDNEGLEKDEIVLALEYKNETVELKPIDILSADKMKLKYIDEDDKTETVNLNGLYIIYNGAAAAHGVDFTPQSGEITLIDNDADGKYDVISILAYTELVFSNTSEKGDIIYGKHSKKIDFSDVDTVKIINADTGSKQSAKAIEKGAIVTGYASNDGDSAEIFTTMANIEGIVTEITSDDETMVNIDGEWYKFSITLDSIVADGNIDKVKAGYNYIWYLNYEGEIAYYEKMSDVFTDYEYAYLLGAEKAKRIGEKNKLKYFSQYSIDTISALAETVYVDDEKLKDEEKILSALTKNGEDGEKTEDIVPQLIRLKVNTAGEITHIDMASEEAKGADSLYVIYDAERDGGLRYYNGARGFVNAANYAPVLGMTTTVPVFAVDAPSKNAVTGTTEVEYTTAKNSFVSGRSEAYDDFIAYGTDSEKINASCVVRYAAASMVFSSTDTFNLCLDVTKALNSEGEIKQQITYTADGTEKKVLVSDEINLESIPYTDFEGKEKTHKLEAGDVFRFIADLSGEVITLELDYSMKENKILLQGRTGDTEFSRVVYPAHPTSASVQLVGGVLEKDSEYMRYASDNPENPTATGMSYLDTMFTGNGRVFVYNRTKQTFRRILSKDDILDYKTVGADCSKGVMVVRNLTPMFLYLYED